MDDKIMNEDVVKDIQFLLFMYEAYIEDMGCCAWENNELIRLAEKYGFNRNNLHNGLEHLCC
jgi:uncharacterized protein Smg (DUF494 family)